MSKSMCVVILTCGAFSLGCLGAKKARRAELEEEAYQKLDDCITHAGRAALEAGIAVFEASRGDVPGGMIAGGMAAFDAKEAYQDFQEAKALFEEYRDLPIEDDDEEENK